MFLMSWISKKSGLVRTRRLKLKPWVHPGRGIYMIWAPYKQQVAQAGPAGRMVGAGLVAGKAAWGQAGISGTKEPRLFLAEYLT